MQYIQAIVYRILYCTNKPISIYINYILTHLIVIFIYVYILFINTVGIATSLG
jgi:hypothetical protein